MKEVQAVILAGGLGTRLRPYTNHTPKPLVKVNGVPFLHYLLGKLKEAGIMDVLLCTGYLGEQIQTLYGDGEEFELRIQYSRENEPLGTGGALLNAEQRLQQRFLLLNGDTYVDLDYSVMTSVACGTPILMAVSSALRMCRNVRLVNGSVASYSKERDDSFNACDAGTYVISKEIITSQLGPKFSLESDVFPDYADRGLISGYRLPTVFFDIGTHAGLDEFTSYAAEHALAGVTR